MLLFLYPFRLLISLLLLEIYMEIFMTRDEVIVFAGEVNLS